MDKKRQCKRKRKISDIWNPITEELQIPNADLTTNYTHIVTSNPVTDRPCKYMHYSSCVNVDLDSPTPTTSGTSTSSEWSIYSTSTDSCETISKSDDDSQLGEQTPHGSKVKSKKIALVSKPCLLTPFHVREIPLPAVSWADTTELSLLMCFKEDVGDKERDPNVFRKHPNLTPRMRAILFDWLMEVCDVYRLRRVTYYLAIDYVDRYLSRVEELPKNQLQLLGITCLFIAAKVEEVYPPKLIELAYVTDGACTDQEMLLKEMVVLKELNWDVSPMTVSGWLNLYTQLCYSSSNIRDFKPSLSKKNDEFIYPQFSGFAFIRASQLIDLCSLDDEMLQYQYSVIAASAMYFIFSRERALYVSGFTWDKIKDCVQWMAPFFMVVNKIQLFSPLEGPKDHLRCGAGLKKQNPNIILDEIHTVQTHSIELKMLEEVYKLIEGSNSSATDDDSCSKDAITINSSSPAPSIEGLDLHLADSDSLVERGTQSE